MPCSADLVHVCVRICGVYPRQLRTDACHVQATLEIFRPFMYPLAPSPIPPSATAAFDVICHMSAVSTVDVSYGT